MGSSTRVGSEVTKELVSKFLAGAGTPNEFVRKLLLHLLPRLPPAELQSEGSGAGVPHVLTEQYGQGLLQKSQYVELVVNSLAPVETETPKLRAVEAHRIEADELAQALAISAAGTAVAATDSHGRYLPPCGYYCQPDHAEPVPCA